MKSKDKFIINFGDKKDGKYTYNFKIDNNFKKLKNTEIKNININLIFEMIKQNSNISLNFLFNGEISLPCFRCNDIVKLKINKNNKICVKFIPKHIEKTELYDDDILYLSDKETKFNISSYVYEFILLSLPIRIVHQNGGCNLKVLEKIKEYNNNRINTENIKDPRWEKLKKIKL